jgi:hypothetical protein
MPASSPDAPPAASPPFLREALFAPSTVRLFGRLFEGLHLGELGVNPDSNAPLLRFLSQADASRKAKLARIYGYSYLGNYYKLLEPAVFLVQGDGTPVTPGQAPIPLSVTGVEFKDEVFAQEVRMWAADQLDMAVRIDITIGWLKDILLEADAMAANNVTANDLSARADAVSRADVVGRADVMTSPRRR